jgi:hypothetical protein
MMLLVPAITAIESGPSILPTPFAVWPRPEGVRAQPDSAALDRVGARFEKLPSIQKAAAESSSTITGTPAIVKPW